MSSVIHYIELPTNIVCPISNEIIGDGIRDVRMSIRTYNDRIKDTTVRCSRCPKGSHYPTDFKDNTEVYNKIMTETEVIKDTLKRYNKEADIISEPDEEIEEEEIIPDTEEVYKLKKEIYDDDYEFKMICDRIANKYQEIVVKSPDTKSNKYSPGDSIRQLIWRKTFRDMNKAYCPICEINEITYDRFQACHIHPKSKSGSNRIDNLLPGCSACNTSMGTEHLYFYAYKVYERILWKVI